jgi:hypothetical protein
MIIVAAYFLKHHQVINHARRNRVGGTGLFPVPTSHTTVRTVRYTAVL